MRHHGVTVMRLRTFSESRFQVTLAAVVITTSIAVLDRHVHHNVPLGLLYLLPMALVSAVSRRWEVPLAAALCTFVAEYSDAFPWNLTQGLARDTLYFFAYAAEGLYISEMISRHRAELSHVAALTSEVDARTEAEEQLRLLVACSSAAIVTADESGHIVQANEAALRMFIPEASRSTPLQQLPVGLGVLLPALSRVPIRSEGAKSLRTMMQCQGFRLDHEPFVADVWFSTYQTPQGTRMTAVIADVSDEFRNREESNLEQIMNGSRLVVGAMAHEMRNVCAAIGLVGQGLLHKVPALTESEDFQALQQLTATLERMTSVELSQVKRSATPIRLQQVIDELHILISTSMRDTSIEVVWEDCPDLPVVWADQQGLVQVFLNLLRNAQAALEQTASPVIRIGVVLKPNLAEVHISDNGPGVPTPEHLFRPFESHAQVTGLGLYLSRAIMSSFRGDLRYEPSARGAHFVVELLIAK